MIVRDPVTSLKRFARVKIPSLLPRFIQVPGTRRFVPLEQLIAAHLDRLFPGMKIVGRHAFRVTRDADVEIEVDEADDLLETLESLLRVRQRSPEAVRLEVDASMPQDLRTTLLRELGLKRSDLYVMEGLVDHGSLWSLTELTGRRERDGRGTASRRRCSRPRTESRATSSRSFANVTCSSTTPTIRFATSVEALVDQAADDPDVLAVKQTIYRTSGEGEAPIVRSLMRAAASGKETVALVELTARGDEEANIAWARTLEKAGVHVMYGVVGLKTHAKTVLVVRREGASIRRYCHIGTGNYNPQTATAYEDVGLLSADPDLTADVADLFNSLTGFSNGAHYRKILVAPGSLRPRLLDFIRGEAEAKDGRIVMKMNSLADPQIIDALYDASAAGASIDLIIRGICCLRPGVDGLSERIRVRSIVGSYLEHSRIFRFGSDARGPRYWIGSADLMPRNLDKPRGVRRAGDRRRTRSAPGGDSRREPLGRLARLGTGAGRLDKGSDHYRDRCPCAPPRTRRGACVRNRSRMTVTGAIRPRRPTSGPRPLLGTILIVFGGLVAVLAPVTIQDPQRDIASVADLLVQTVGVAVALLGWWLRRGSLTRPIDRGQRGSNG